MRIPFTLEEGAIDPVRAYTQDAGMDLHVLEDTWIGPSEGKDVRSGVRIELPPSHYARIIGRSSALRKKGVLVVEGIIDQGFRGELFSYVYNVGRKAVILHRGDSVAQVIVSPVPSTEWVKVEKLEESERGERGFGSSGR